MSSPCADWGLAVFARVSVEMELAREEIDRCCELFDCGWTVLDVKRWQRWVSRSWECCCLGRLF
jgi:hypothetical protein